MRYAVLDIDGVLADFVMGFTLAGYHLFDTPVYSNGQQRDWHTFEGLTISQINKLWETVKRSTTFWEFLPELVTPGDKLALRGLRRSGFSLLYLTLRPGVEVERQTRSWLVRHGFPDHDHVEVTDDKVAFLRGFVKPPDEVSAILDDRPGELERMHEAKMPIVARDWPYNRNVQLLRVGSVAEFCDVVTRADASGH